MTTIIVRYIVGRPPAARPADTYATPAPGIRSRPYSWTPSQRVIARSRAKIASIFAAGLPADVTEMLVSARMWLTSEELSILRRTSSTASRPPVRLIPRPGRPATVVAR